MLRRFQMVSLMLAVTFPHTGGAQKLTTGPATDTSAQASPIQAAPHAPVVDTSTQASPVSFASERPEAGLPPQTALSIKLLHAIDSGTLKNGQTVAASLEKPVHAGGIVLAEGTPVELTVVGTVPAGRISAAGEFSLQLVRAGKLDVSTEIQTYRGTPGTKDLPDSAPAVGTDAGLPVGAALTFHVQPAPQPETGPPGNAATLPGSITGFANGSLPPAGSTPSSTMIQSIDASTVKGLATTGAPPQPK